MPQILWSINEFKMWHRQEKNNGMEFTIIYQNVVWKYFDNDGNCVIVRCHQTFIAIFYVRIDICYFLNDI